MYLFTYLLTMFVVFFSVSGLNGSEADHLDRIAKIAESEANHEGLLKEIRTTPVRTQLKYVEILSKSKNYFNKTQGFRALDQLVASSEVDRDILVKLALLYLPEENLSFRGDVVDFLATFDSDVARDGISKVYKAAAPSERESFILAIVQVQPEGWVNDLAAFFENCHPSCIKVPLMLIGPTRLRKETEFAALSNLLIELLQDTRVEKEERVRDWAHSAALWFAPAFSKKPKFASMPLDQRDKEVLRLRRYLIENKDQLLPILKKTIGETVSFLRKNHLQEIEWQESALALNRLLGSQVLINAPLQGHQKYREIVGATVNQWWQEARQQPLTRDSVSALRKMIKAVDEEQRRLLQDQEPASEINDVRWKSLDVRYTLDFKNGFDGAKNAALFNYYRQYENYILKNPDSPTINIAKQRLNAIKSEFERRGADVPRPSSEGILVSAKPKESVNTELTEVEQPEPEIATQTMTAVTNDSISTDTKPMPPVLSSEDEIGVAKPSKTTRTIVTVVGVIAFLGLLAIGLKMSRRE